MITVFLVGMLAGIAIVAGGIIRGLWVEEDWIELAGVFAILCFIGLMVATCVDEAKAKAANKINAEAAK